MSRFLIERYRRLKPYTPGEQPKDSTIIKLNTNESPYPPGPETAAAVSGTDSRMLRLYPDPETAALRQALAGLFCVQKENVFTAAGSDDVLNFAFMAFAGDGGKVYFPDVTYGFYQVFAELHGADSVKIPLKDDFSICAEDYVCRDGMIVIANPNAPTGMALCLNKIEEIVRTNRDNVVVIDEAYVDFGAESAAELIYKYDNLLVVQTFSKSRSLAGARLGFALGSPALIRDLERIRYSTNPYQISRMAEAAGTAAVRENSYYMENCRRIVKTRSRVTEALRAMGFHVLASKANFVFAEYPGADGAWVSAALRTRGILVRHFADEKIKNFIRVTIGTEEEMTAFLAAAGEIVEELA